MAHPDRGWGLISLVMALLVVFGMSGVGRSIRRLARSLEGNSRIERNSKRYAISWTPDVARQSAELQRVIAETDADIAELNRIAMKDSLTGLYNRRHLTSNGHHRCFPDSPDRSHSGVGDHRPRRVQGINDEMSHLTGDAVLARTAELMSQRRPARMTRSPNRRGRFLILMPDCGVEDAASTARRIAQRSPRPRGRARRPRRNSRPRGAWLPSTRGSDPLGRAMAAAIFPPNCRSSPGCEGDDGTDREAGGSSGGAGGSVAQLRGRPSARALGAGRCLWVLGFIAAGVFLVLPNGELSAIVLCAGSVLAFGVTWLARRVSLNGAAALMSGLFWVVLVVEPATTGDLSTNAPSWGCGGVHGGVVQPTPAVACPPRTDGLGGAARPGH